MKACPWTCKLTQVYVRNRLGSGWVRSQSGFHRAVSYKSLFRFSLLRTFPDSIDRARWLFRLQQLRTALEPLRDTLVNFLLKKFQVKRSEIRLFALSKI
jgi:hypothetical protein